MTPVVGAAATSVVGAAFVAGDSVIEMVVAEGWAVVGGVAAIVVEGADSSSPPPHDARTRTATTADVWMTRRCTVPRYRMAAPSAIGPEPDLDVSAGTDGPTQRCLGYFSNAWAPLDRR